MMLRHRKRQGHQRDWYMNYILWGEGEGLAPWQVGDC